MRVSRVRMGLSALLIALTLTLVTPAVALATDLANPLRPTDPYCWALDAGHQWVGSTQVPHFTPGDTSRQCVEYVKRFFYYGWNYKANDGTVTNAYNWTGNGRDYYGSAAVKALDAFPNGGTARPAPGDLLCMGGGASGLGHVAIITAVSDTGISFLQQNRASFGSMKMTRTAAGAYVVTPWAGYTVQGWLRRRLHPAKLSTVGGVALSPGPYYVGRTVTGSFIVKNTGERTGTWAPLILAFRGPAGQNKDAWAASMITLAPGASAKVYFSRYLDLEGNWTGFVSGRFAGTAWQSPGTTVAFPVRWPTGTVRVNLYYDNWKYWLWAPHINPATIYVYGPRGYYRSVRFGGTGTSGQTISYAFTGAPAGAYRVRVAWANANDSGAQESNQYFSTTLSNWNYTSGFTSP